MAKRPLPAYEGDEACIFVTYAHEDAGLVYPQIRWLQDQGFNVWWDEGISPGAVWRAEVAQAIRRCSLLVYFVTPNSVVSEHASREVNFALDEHHRPVLAVHLVETVLPDALALSLSDRQAILEHALEPGEYERKLVSAIATYLNQALPDIAIRVPRRGFARQSAWAYVAVGVVVGAAVATLAIWDLAKPDPPRHRPLARFVVDVPPGVSIVKAGTMPLSISRDGARIAFSGTSEHGNVVYLRKLHELVASPVPGTGSDATSVLLAPDGESIAYLGLQGVLKRIATTDGRPSLIAQDATRGMSWAADGTIVFSTRAGDLARVSVSDPVPEVLVQAPDGQRYSQPHLLPDGGAMLFVVTEGDDRGDYSEARIVALSLDDGEKRSLTDGMAPLVTTRGQLLFAKDGSVWAVNFDRNRLQVVGTPTPVLNDVEFALGPGPIFSVADNGAMVYLPKLAAYRLAWMTREGSDAHEIPMPMSPAVYAQPQISPDGRSVLLRVHKPNTSQLWRYSFDRGTLTKLHDNAITFLWSADSSTIYYSRVGDGQVTLVRRKADGTGTEEVLIDNERDQFPTSRSRDGDAVFYHECDDYVSACDIGRLTIISGEPFGELLLNGEYSERAPAASPNGRWLAYESDQSGRYEIYVRPYPDLTAGRWQISKDGGRNPVWSPDAGTLYYEAGLGESRQIFAVSVSSDDEFSAGIPEYLFEFRSAFLMGIVRNHDLHPDGSRFLVATPDERQSERLIYVENWLDEVERLAPRDL